MSQIRDLHHESHHGCFPPLHITNYNNCVVHDYCNHDRGHHGIFPKRESREDMWKIQDEETNKEGENYDLEMDKVQVQV